MFRVGVSLLAMVAGCGLPGIENFKKLDARVDDAAIDAPADLEPLPIDAPDARPIDARPIDAPDAMIDAPDAPDIDAPDAPPDAPPSPCALPSLDLVVATLAGCTDYGTIDGDRSLTRFWNPVNVLAIPAGGAFVADYDSSRLRRIDMLGNTITLVNKPNFVRPFGMTLGSDGTLYVETDANDFGNTNNNTGTIWAIDPGSGAATVIARNLGRPRGLLTLPDGRLVASDFAHHVIGILDPVTRDYAILAGSFDTPGYVNASGFAARFQEPYDIVLASDHLSIVVADRGNHRLRRVALADGAVTDFAGAGTIGNVDGTLATATFDQPQGLAQAADGTIYVSDVSGHRVRRVKDGFVVTIAGDGVGGWADTDVPLEARFYSMEGLDISADNTTLIVADGNQGDGTAEHRVRLVHLNSPAIPPNPPHVPPAFSRAGFLAGIQGALRSK